MMYTAFDVNLFKCLYVAILFPFNVIAFAMQPTWWRAFNVFLVLFFTIFWMWEWERKLKARTELFLIELTFPTMTESEKEKAIIRIYKLGARLKLEPYDIAKIFKLIN